MMSIHNYNRQRFWSKKLAGKIKHFCQGSGLGNECVPSSFDATKQGFKRIT